MKNVLLYLCILAGCLSLRGQSVAHAKPSLEGGINREPALVVKPNHPNPFYEQTTIEFFLAAPQEVTIEMYNVLGVKVSTLLREHLDSGEHTLVYKRPADLPEGVYIYSVKTPTVSRSQRMIIRK